MAERFPHPRGLVYFEIFWHLHGPETTVHRVEGPWKVGDSVIRVLGCHGTDGLLARQYDEWRAYLTEHGDSYPERAFIEAIARRLGALVDRAG